MTDEKTPFSFAAPFTAPTPEPEAVESNQSFCDKVMALDDGDTLNLVCSRDEASQIYEETRTLRQVGKVRVNYEDGNLTARKIKD